MAQVSNQYAINKTVLKNNQSTSAARWSFIALLFAASIIKFLMPSSAKDVMDIVLFPIIPGLAFFHGTKRYGLKNMVFFFVITWGISNFFESLSIGMGFPFGNYHYTSSIPRVFDVPFVIMIAYFGMGYMAWTLSHILNGQYGKKLRGIQIFLVPFIASFIMVMWDVVMDPLTSTISKEWIWEDGGNYFGVPISNYLGWFFVVYVFMQIFAIFLSKYDTKGTDDSFSKTYWLEAVAIYGIQSMNYLLLCVTRDGNREIYSSMGLVSVFTMVFVTILSAITVNRPGEFSRISRESHSARTL
ncbi:MAG: carotenoid biosynthesis protein [Gorillibacterium sp.]|nr:carotenoid biosynthesis protein [Gorillibacterium sp.]